MRLEIEKKEKIKISPNNDPVSYQNHPKGTCVILVTHFTQVLSMQEIVKSELPMCSAGIAIKLFGAVLTSF